MPKPHLILCGGTELAGPGDAVVHRLELGKGTGRISLGVDAITEKMVQDLSGALRDLLEIATYVYVADQAVSRGGTTQFEYGQKWVRRLDFRIPVREYEIWSDPEVSGLLAEALSFASGDVYRFHFGQQPTNEFPQFLDFAAAAEPQYDYDEVVLFSGGLDSFAGAVDEVVDHNACPILVSHQSNRKMTRLQRRLHEYIVGLHTSGLKPLHVPVMINKDRRLTRETSQRSRSFLYACLGTIVAKMFGLNRVKFYENGVVSCKLPFDGQTLQARSTRVTHPKFLHLLSTVISEVTGSDFHLENPYFLKTKTEVCLRLRELLHEAYIRETRSCAKSIYRSPSNHCGTCSQCIDRRFATLASECQQYDPDWLYALNIFTDELHNVYDRTMASGFVGFASRFETMTIEGFVQKFLPDINEIARYMEGRNSEEKLTKLFTLHQRHAEKVNEVIEAKCKENISAIRRGKLPVTCLVSMVARGEHLKVAELLKVDKGKPSRTKTRKRRRRVSSELTRREKEVYTLVHLRGKTSRQAAIEMRCTPQNVSQLLKKAEEKIKAQTSRSISSKQVQKLPEDKRGQVNLSEDQL